MAAFTAYDAPLTSALVARADEATRTHWERYLKGDASFLGVPMAGVRSVVRGLWRSELAALGTARQLDVFRAWAQLPYTEQRLAAVLMVAEHLSPDLADEHVVDLAWPLDRGHFADWNIVDWFAVKALARFVAAGDRAARSAAVLQWGRAPGLWQRRAAVVAFVPHAQAARAFLPELPELLLEACRENVTASEERWAHTGVGWVLRELSVTEPDLVAAFVDDSPLNPEGRRMALARTRPGRYRRR
jgi:3-methyladenine DNA glycosylase AlkD